MPYPPVIQFEARRREVEDYLALMRSIPRAETTSSLRRRLRRRRVPIIQAIGTARRAAPR